MNKKIILFIGLLFYGSFDVMIGTEAPVALFKEVKTAYGNYGENGEIIPIMATVPTALTAEGKKIYDDLIVKYRNGTLTFVDNTQRNLDVLKYQKQILWEEWVNKTYSRWSKAGTVEKALFIPLSLGSAALVNYAGYLGHSSLNYFINKESLSSQKTTLQFIDKLFSKGTSIGSILLLAFAGYVAAYDTIADVHNFFAKNFYDYLYSQRKKEIDREIALIDTITKILENLKK